MCTDYKFELLGNKITNHRKPAIEFDACSMQFFHYLILLEKLSISFINQYSWSTAIKSFTPSAIAKDKYISWYLVIFIDSVIKVLTFRYYFFGVNFLFGFTPIIKFKGKNLLIKNSYSIQQIIKVPRPSVKNLVSKFQLQSIIQ